MESSIFIPIIFISSFFVEMIFCQINQNSVPPNPVHAGLPGLNNDHVHNFGDQKEIQDQEHLKSHLNGQMNPEQKMNDEQMRYHYFKMHDTNHDNMLDGIELIKALTHSHSNPNETAKNANVPKRLSDLDLERMVDQILSLQDLDNNGFIDYAEFMKTRPQPAHT